MRSTLCLGLALAVVATAAAPAKADDRSEITALYAKLEKAFQKKDIKGIHATATPGFYIIENGKKSSGKQLDNELEQAFSMMGMASMKMKPTKITVTGKKATAMSDAISKLTMADPKDGKSHTIVFVGTSREALVKTPAGWRFTSSTMLKSTATRDGKPFDPSQMTGGPPPAK
jgi:ketosteroid isomerase-like protein